MPSCPQASFFGIQASFGCLHFSWTNFGKQAPPLSTSFPLSSNAPFHPKVQKLCFGTFLYWRPVFGGWCLTLIICEAFRFLVLKNVSSVSKENSCTPKDTRRVRKECFSCSIVSVCYLQRCYISLHFATFIASKPLPPELISFLRQIYCSSFYPVWFFPVFVVPSVLSHLYSPSVFSS